MHVLLQPTDGPVFKARPKSMEADHTAKITLTCDVMGNPAPEILWIHEPNDKVSRLTYHERNKINV